MSYQDTFKRYEKKYILNEKQYGDLISSIYTKLEYDIYRKYKICNIYFDTPSYDLIRESIEKPIYKEKLRLRSYGTPKEDDMVFLEIKKKYKGVVYKRRIALPYKEAVDYCINGRLPEAGDHQITSEIDWFMHRYDLYPMLYLSYDREAMRGKDDENLRVTFDSNVTWRSDQLDMSKGDFGNVIVEQGKYIMEIKICDAMPIWLADALTELEIFSQSFSKYGTVYQEDLAKQFLENIGGITCA